MENGFNIVMFPERYDANRTFRFHVTSLTEFHKIFNIIVSSLLIETVIVNNHICKKKFPTIKDIMYLFKL